MDESIRPVTPEIMRQFGAAAFDRGVPIDGHNMNPGAPAIADWQQGWRDRRATVHARELVRFASGVGSPP
jgi:hypothetical protein